MDTSVDSVLAELATASLNIREDAAPQLVRGAHASLDAMLRLAELRKLPTAGDGNCAYHAGLAGLDDADALARLGLQRLEHPGTSRGATASDLKQVVQLRGRCVDWLQRDESAEHRRVGTYAGPLVRDEASGEYIMPPPPPATSLEPHRELGVYAQAPQLRALAEVLQCTIVAVDSSSLFDRVPVYAPGRKQTVRIRAWSTQLVPLLLAQRGRPTGHPPDPPVPAAGGGRERSAAAEHGANGIVVIISNGRTDAAGHFDATRPCGT